MSKPKVMKFGFLTVPHVNKTTESTYMDIRERDLRLADVFATALHVDYEIVKAMDGEYGRMLNNGSYTGMMGLIQREEADLIVTEMSITDDRIERFNFSPVYIVDGIAFIGRKPQLAPKFQTILYPFSLGVWLSVLVCFLLMCIVFYLVLRGKYSLQRVILKAFGSLLNQGPVFEPDDELKERLIAVFWATGTMLLIFSYSAVLLSFLTLPIRERGIQNIPELAEAIVQNKYHASIYKGANFPDLLKASNDKNLQIIGEDMLANPSPMSDIKELLLDRKERFVYLISRTYASFLNSHCVGFKENFILGLGAVPFKKSFCCPERLNRAVLAIISAGLFQKQQNDITFRTFLDKFTPEERSEAEHEPVLGMEDFYGAFSFLIVGYVISFFVFFIEMIVGRVKK